MDMEGEESPDPMEGESEELKNVVLRPVTKKKKILKLMVLPRMRVKIKIQIQKVSLLGDESAEDEGDSESKDSSDEESEDSSGKHDDFGGGASRGEMVEGGKSVEIDPSSFTDKIFRNREGELVQDADSGYFTIMETSSGAGILQRSSLTTKRFMK